MIPFERVGDDLVAELDDLEVTLVTSLVAQICDLLGGAAEQGGAPASGGGDDPFARWADEMTAEPLDRSDPLVRRLFPDASADDLTAAEHRRFSEDALRRGRIEDSGVVLADLEATGNGQRPLVVTDEHLGAWLKTLNGVRLGLAVRLGIEDSDDHDALERLSARDPRAQLVSLYDWLGAVLESLLEASARPGGAR